MTDLHPPDRIRWPGVVALGWIALIAAAWLAVYGGVPLPRWVGVVRLFRELGLLAFLLGAAFGWGRLVLRGWHTRPGQAENPFWAFGLGFGVLWLATFVAAAVHLLGPAWPWLLLGGGWTALLATLPRQPRLRLPKPQTWSTAEWFLLVVMGCSLAYALLAWALVPPLAWDEVSYHLPIPQGWIAAKGFVNIPTMAASNWPLGLELVHTLSLMMGSEILPHLTLTSMAVLTALGLASFSRQQFDRQTAWLAATLYLAMPMVKYLAGVALVEAGTGFYGFLAIWAGYVWLETGEWRELILAALLGGLAASLKLTNAAIPVAVGSTGVLWLMLRRRSEARRHVIQFASYGLIALLVAAPWYVKSIYYSGNPIWPFLFQWLGGRNWDLEGSKLYRAHLQRPNLPTSVRSYVGGLWYVSVRGAQSGGLRMGAAVLAFAPLSLLFWRERRWLLSYLLACVGIVYTFWFMASHQARFLMPIVPLLALLTAYAVSRLLQVWPTWLASLARVALLLYFVLGLPFVKADDWGRIVDRWPYVAGRESREEFLERRVKGYAAFQFANANLPADANVLLAPWETRGYYLERSSIWANPSAQRVIKWEELSTPEEVRESLRAMGITHIFWNDQRTSPAYPYESQVRSIVTALLQRYARPIYSDNGYAIYELTQAVAP